MGMDDLIPAKPSGWHQACRSRLGMVEDAANLGLDALTPPVVGAIPPLVGGVLSTAENLIHGDVRDAAASAASMIPAAAGGFFGGGLGDDIAQGIADEGAAAVGADRANLRGSSAENLAEDATCRTAGPPQKTPEIYAAPAPHKHKAPVTKSLPSKKGWNATVTFES